jgi:ribonuclease-3
MSQPRLHQKLFELFENKESILLKECLTHPDYQAFMKQFGIDVPLEELAQAFTHTSFSHEFEVPHQEQLEFLGDSVLQLILTEELYRLYPQEKEGRLSKLRSAIVNEKSLATLSSTLKLSELILVGKGEFTKGLYQQEMVQADTFEALLGQIYRHHGLDFTKKVFLNWLSAALPGALSWDFLQDFDAKSTLQERSLAKFKKLPHYTAEPEGEKFLVKLWINEEMMASGVFSSKKSGEKELAQEVLKKKII